WVQPSRKETEKLYFLELWCVMCVAHQNLCSWDIRWAQYRAKSIAIKQRIKDHQEGGIFHGTTFQKKRTAPKVTTLIRALIPTLTRPIVAAAKKSLPS